MSKFSLFARRLRRRAKREKKSFSGAPRTPAEGTLSPLHSPMTSLTLERTGRIVTRRKQGYQQSKQKVSYKGVQAGSFGSCTV